MLRTAYFNGFENYFMLNKKPPLNEKRRPLCRLNEVSEFTD